VNGMARKWQGEEALRRDLQPGERLTAGSLVTSGPSRRVSAALAMVWLVLAGAGVEGLVGPIEAGPVVALAILPSLGLGVWFLWRPMYAAVTDRRLICYPLSRLRGTARRPALTVSLADLRIVGYQSGKYSGTSVRCEVPGRRPLLLHARREEFAGVDRVLAHAGAYAKLDPPYPRPGI